MEKCCNKCLITKPVTEFNKRSENGRPTPYCKDCDRERRRLMAQKRHADPQHRRKVTVREKLWRYGITQAQLDLMEKRSGGSCEICLTPFTSSFRIDHCHTTGVVRGLLCHGCNVALGHLRDSTTTLLRAVEYLNERNRIQFPPTPPL